MNPRKKAIKSLNADGYELKRNGTNHDIYYNRKLGCMIPLKRHDFDEDDLMYILKEIKHNKRVGG